MLLWQYRCLALEKVVRESDHMLFPQALLYLGHPDIERHLHPSLNPLWKQLYSHTQRYVVDIQS